MLLATRCPALRPASARRRAQRASPRCGRPGRSRSRPGLDACLGAARLRRSGPGGGGPAQVPQRPHRRGVAGRRHGRPGAARAGRPGHVGAHHRAAPAQPRVRPRRGAGPQGGAPSSGCRAGRCCARVPGPPQTGRTLLERRDGPAVPGPAHRRRGRRCCSSTTSSPPAPPSPRRRAALRTVGAAQVVGLAAAHPGDRSTIRAPSPIRRSCRCRSRSVVATRRSPRA